MRKLLITALLTTISGISVMAQKDTAFAFVRYTLTHISDTTQPENPNKENTILYLGKNMSMYANYDRIERMKNTGSPFGIQMMSSNGGPLTPMAPPPPAQIIPYLVSGNYYKDIPSSKMSFMVYTNQKLFAVEENTPTVDWTITQDAKEIMGLQCQKATGDFKGRTYEAWFTSQLPYSNGPWKLGGLPGLIVEASDTKKEVVFKMVSFENASGTQVPMEIPESASKTTQKEFNQYKEALERDRQAMIGSTSAGGMTVRGTITASTTTLDGKPVKPKQMNNPIEKVK